MVRSILIVSMLVWAAGVAVGRPDKPLPRTTIEEDSTRYVGRLGDGMIIDLEKGCDLRKIGILKTKTVAELTNDLTIGCEVLDRDYTDYEEYKEYLPALGMRKIRLQSGWAKTEKEKGIYNFDWLDRIIDDAISKGLKIWLEVSYGNPIYSGGGTPFLKGGWPSSDEGLEGWDNYVKALASHYKDRVHEWELWNEPDVNKERGEDYNSIADLNIRTAEIIRRVDPKAKIAALALALINDTTLTVNCMREFNRRGKQGLFDWISYHQYMYRPEDMYPLVDKLRDAIGHYSSSIRLWQGESGAPSGGKTGGALSGYDWTETSQAKWALRRILGDHARDIATGIFSISDMNYGSDDGIKKKNIKGLLMADENKRIVRPKKGYFAVRNLVTLYELLGIRLDSERITIDRDYSCSKFIYEAQKDGLQSLLLWWDKDVPFNFNVSIPAQIKVTEGKFRNPVIVDILSGNVYEIPGRNISNDGNNWIFRNIPVYDSPIMITDLSLISIDQ